MKYLISIGIIGFLNIAIAQKKPNLDFPLGEQIKFKVNYGWFTLGEASMSLADTLIQENGKSYYNSFIEAKTVGMFSWLAGIENTYWGLVNTDNFKTIKSEKHLNERSGIIDQWNTFDYEKNETDVLIVNFDQEESRKEVTVKLNDNTYDLHGTYMLLRSKLWSDYELGDSLLLSTYWETKLYDFGMEYGGTAKVKYDGEKYLTHKFYGLFPVTRTFPKEKAVTVYVLERNGMGIPLLIEADLKIGKVKCELKSYEIDGRKIDLSN